MCKNRALRSQFRVKMTRILWSPRNRFRHTGCPVKNDDFGGVFNPLAGKLFSVTKPISDAAYLHRWLSATIHFNRYNLCFYKYTECGDKCNVLYFTALHIRVVPPSFSHFEECPLSDSTCWLIGYFRMDVTERLLNTKVVVFLGFLWFAVDFLLVKYNEIFDSLEKV